MKRKETSKLLNEWKNFLNEVENNEMVEMPTMDSQNNLNLSVNEDLETIVGVMFEKGMEAEEIHAALQRLSQLTPEDIAAKAQEYNDSFYPAPLEKDEELSQF